MSEYLEDSLAAKAEKTYDLRNKDEWLWLLFNQIQPRHGINWRTKTHSITGVQMTNEKAHEFINRHGESEIIAAVIFDYGVTVYLVDKSSVNDEQAQES